MLDLFRRKTDFEKVAKEMSPDKSYILVIPEGMDPVDLIKTTWFDDKNVFIVQANKLTLLELG